MVPGGHIELGERMEDALRREVKEETGLDVYDVEFLGFQEFVFDDAFWKKRHFIFFDYVCRTDSTDVTLNSEAQKYVWVTLEEALELPIEPYTEVAIRKYLNVTEQKGFTLWFTGLSGSGKTVLAKAVEAELRSRGLKVERLDGDTVRQSLTKDLGFSKEDRDTNIERVTFVAKLLTRNGVAVLCSFISPYRERRAKSRAEIGHFVECYVECPLEVCMERDVKGLYQRAMAGEIENFTGISDPYEPPENPEIVVNTAQQSLEESVGVILRRLEELGYLGPEEEVYSAEDEAAVEERLRALGYI